MELEKEEQAVLARPLEALERVRPRCAEQERLARPDLDGPVWHGHAHPVEARTGDLRKVLLGLGSCGGDTKAGCLGFGTALTWWELTMNVL